MEHRWGERVTLNIPVQVECGTRGTALGVVRDASASGAFICTAAQIPLWSNVRVDFIGTHALSVDAQVVRRAADGFGLEWSELAPPPIVDLLNAPRVATGLQQPAVGTPAQAPSPIADPVPARTSVSPVAEETAAGPAAR